MSHHTVHAIVWLCGLLTTSLLKADCPYQECDCAETDIYCTEKGLKTLQLMVNRKITGYTSLYLDGNPLTAIPSGSLPPNLTEITMTDNPITIIGDSAFDASSATLKSLTISDARFSRIPDALRKLRSLQELHIARVPITDWSVDVMKNIGPTLKVLYLEWVDLSISPSWLQYFSRLTDLSILGSLLSSLPDNALDLMANSLTSLTLYNNSLTEIPKAMSKLKSLQTLYLTFNKVSGTRWLPSSSKLVTLSLNGNHIYNASELSNSLRPYASSLMSFDIEQNELTAIPDLSFLLHVQDFNFMYNKISDSNSGSMPGDLKSLNLQFNSLPTIPRIMSRLKALSEMILPSNAIRDIQGQDFAPAATTVVLGYNHITELTDTSFPEHSVIESLYLNNNPISKISSLAFKHLTGLSELSLQNTKLTRLPLALSSLERLCNLDMTFTAGLVCTCLEKSLEHWIVSLNQENVAGDCGKMTIYNFFATLSPGCPVK